ncbi:MAG: NUDIX hydrolase [Ruminococcus sp.]
MEVPAGKLEKGEDPADCGKRELREEAGRTCGKYTSLGKLFPTPAYDTEVIHMYLAQELSAPEEQELDEGEFLDVTELPLEDAVQMVMNNEIPDAKTQIALLKTWVLLHKGSDRRHCTASCAGIKKPPERSSDDCGYLRLTQLRLLPAVFPGTLPELRLHQARCS